MMKTLFCQNAESIQCGDAFVIKYSCKTDTLSFPCQTSSNKGVNMSSYVFEDGDFISDVHFRI